MKNFSYFDPSMAYCELMKVKKKLKIIYEQYAVFSTTLKNSIKIFLKPGNTAGKFTTLFFLTDSKDY